MKRGFVNSHQLHGFLKNSNINHKYRSLLEDYLELQKEYVSKKKKLQVEKRKREILLDEVRFLKRRHKYLAKSQFAMLEPKLGPHQNVDIHDMLIREERNHVVDESNSEQEGKGREEILWKTMSIKKPKRKISWHDKAALKV